MTKTLHISLMPALILAAFLLLSVFVALPSGAQTTTPKDSCTLVKDVPMKTADGTDTKILKGSVVSDGSTVVAAPTMGGPAIPVAIKQWGLVCLINTVNIITDWVFIALLVVAVAFIAIAGFMWMTAGGNAEKQKQAGQMIAAAVVGIIIAILARVIPGVVTGILL